jgi:hypothetical protein
MDKPAGMSNRPQTGSNTRIIPDNFERVYTIGDFISCVTDCGGGDAIVSLDWNAYARQVRGEEEAGDILYRALSVAVYSLDSLVRFDRRVGAYTADPKTTGLKVRMRGDEYVVIFNPMAPLEYVSGAIRARDRIVSRLSKAGIGSYDGGTLSASEEMLYIPPFSEHMCGYQIGFFYGKTEPPGTNGVMHSIIEEGRNQHLGVWPESFDSDYDDWHGRWNASEPMRPRSSCQDTRT